MEVNALVNAEKMREVEIEIMLHINQRLYEKGHITEEMFSEFKNRVLTS